MFRGLAESAAALSISERTLGGILRDYQIGMKIGGWKLTEDEIDRIRGAIAGKDCQSQPLRGLKPRRARAQRLTEARVPWHERKTGTKTRPKRWRCPICRASLSVYQERCQACKRSLLPPAEVARKLICPVVDVIAMAEARVFGRKVRIFRDDEKPTWWRFTADEVEAVRKDFHSPPVSSNSKKLIELHAARRRDAKNSQKNSA